MVLVVAAIATAYLGEVGDELDTPIREAELDLVAQSVSFPPEHGHLT
jgi:hypothetical protein